ncbi:coiled-coil domain-containing protein 183-like [Chlamydotis macqueenii]
MAKWEATAEQKVCGVRQLEVPQQRFHGHRELSSVRGDSPMATSPRGSGAAMAAAQVARSEGEERSAGAGQGRKAKPSQRVQELRAILALQEQGRKFLTQSREEKLSQNRELLPGLREVLEEDAHALGIAQKRNKLTISEACGAQKHLDVALARKTVEVGQEKVRAEIYDRANVCNMLLYQMRQRSQVLDELQQRWQRQLQAAAKDEKRHQAQGQAICQLENNIEKMFTAVHTGQTVTALYLAVRDVLRKELAHLPPQLDLLCGMAELCHGELEDMELIALDALKAADVTKEDMAEMKTRFLAERDHRYRSLATLKEHTKRLWLKEAMKRHQRAHGTDEFTVDNSTLNPDDPLVGATLEATKSRLGHEAWVTEKMEKAKAAAQCSCLWDIPIRLLEQQKSSVDMEAYLKECKEKKQALEQTLKELELKQAELKFGQPPGTTSCMDVNVVGSRILEEELRMKLQREEARLERMRAQMLRNRELLLEFENGIDNLFVHLHGITMPGQDDSVKARRVEEKLQHCEQKLQYLVQRVADLPTHRQSPDEENEVRRDSVLAVVFGDPHGVLPHGPSQAVLPAGRMEVAPGKSHGAAQPQVALGTVGHPPQRGMETFVKVRNILEQATANDAQNLKVCLKDIGSSVQDPNRSSPLSPPDPFDFGDKDHDLVLTREDIKKQGLHVIESKKKSRKK